MELNEKGIDRWKKKCGTATLADFPIFWVHHPPRMPVTTKIIAFFRSKSNKSQPKSSFATGIPGGGTLYTTLNPQKANMEPESVSVEKETYHRPTNHDKNIPTFWKGLSLLPPLAYQKRLFWRHRYTGIPNISWFLFQQDQGVSLTISIVYSQHHLVPIIHIIHINHFIRVISQLFSPWSSNVILYLDVPGR